MTQFYDRYYPTVSLRRGEMRGFEKLVDAEKQKTLPVVLLAPWLNSIKFENSFNILQKSIGDQLIIVDLDRYYESSSPLESRVYFWSLLEKENGPKKWMTLVEEHENYIPCLQFIGIEEALFKDQLEWARNLGRGFCIRFELNMLPKDFEFSSLLSKIRPTDDSLIILDFGYHDYSAELSNEIKFLLDGIFDISPDFKVVVSGSNFPNDFSDFDNFSQSQPNSARQIYNEVKAQYDNYSVFFGDWASTKPRKYDGHGSPPLPRIDYPVASQWIMARSKSEKWNFQDAALRITRLTEWENRPKIWGTGVIERTALGLPGGIKTHPEVIAARINIHLFVQANANLPNPPSQPKGKWKDPI